MRQSEPGDVHAKLVVVRQVLGDGLEAADGAEIFGAKGHGRPEGEIRHAEQPRHHHAGREFGGDAQSLGARGRGIGVGAVKAGHQADGGVVQRRRYRAQVVRLHANVAVVDQQQRVARVRDQFRQHPGLDVGVGGLDRVGSDGNRGKLPLEAVNILERRVGGIAYAEEDFELGIILAGVGNDGFVESRVAAMHRL